MRLFKADGSRVTLAAFPASADPDPIMVLTQDLWTRRSYGEPSYDKDPNGSIKSRYIKAGAKLRQSQINRLFVTATVKQISPATGGVAGGTVVTIIGTDLDGTTSVTFGGTAGTNLTVVSPEKLTVTAPAHTAGAVTVALVDDGGPVSVSAGYTYA